MIELLEILKARIILHTKHVEQLKEAIEKKYPDISNSEEDELLKEVIRKILESRLEGISKDLVEVIREELEQQWTKEDTEEITVYNVIQTYVKIDSEPGKKDSKLLSKWLEKHTERKISMQEVESICNTIKEELIAYPAELEKIPLDKKEQEQEQQEVINQEKKEEQTEDNEEDKEEATSKKGSKLLAFMAATILSTSVMGLVQSSRTEQIQPAPTLEEWLDSVVYEPKILVHTELQPHLQYKKIDEHALKVFLLGRNSILAREPYFESMMQVAREFFINPLLLFAITGQEQGFVKESHPRAKEIANNPFNVFGSWQDFNTNILDTSRIAARTIITLSKGCPEGEDQIKWINRKYAEDPDWHKGVTSILNMLEGIAG